jgi:hypothetical protein
MERISLEECYQLPVVQFLNDLQYLKFKGEYNARMERKRQ